MTQQHTHTPGPWQRNIRAEGKYPVVFSGRNNHIATVCQQENGNETEANIDLIAAAPDLLEALEGIVTDWEHCGSPPLDGVIGLKQLRAARAAIAKARGQS